MELIFQEPMQQHRFVLPQELLLTGNYQHKSMNFYLIYLIMVQEQAKIFKRFGHQDNFKMWYEKKMFLLTKEV